jgi:hypothetical protein
MRKALILLPVLLLGGCHVAFGQGSGEKTTRDFQVGGFDRIALAGSGDVEVRTGAAISVRAEGDKEAIDRLDVRVENGTLKIGRKTSTGWTFGLHHDRLRFYVTVPALSAASIAGSGDMRIDAVKGARFEGSIAGSGDLGIAHMEVGEATFSIAGSGDVSASGKAGKASFSTAGSGDIKAGGLQAGTVSVTVMGAGDIQAHATQSADVSIMGSGDVRIAGTKNCNIHKAGSGSISCG